MEEQSDSIIHCCFGSIDSLRPLVNLEELRSLRLKDNVKNLCNPVCQTLSHYKETICSLLGTLTILDGEIVCGAGSEVFEMCDKLEQKLNDSEAEEKNIGISTINHGLVEELNKKQRAVLSSSTSESKLAWSAEQQFKEVLEQCQSLNQDAEKAINDAKHALWGPEKDG